MKVSGGGFEQCSNGQVAGDMGMLIVATGTAACNDTAGWYALEQIRALPLELGWPVNLVAGAGTSPRPTSWPVGAFHPR